MAAGGVVEFTGWRGMGQGRIELAGVHRLPDFLGPFSNVRFAGRVVAQGAWPDQGQFYAAGRRRSSAGSISPNGKEAPSGSEMPVAAADG